MKEPSFSPCKSNLRICSNISVLLRTEALLGSVIVTSPTLLKHKFYFVVWTHSLVVKFSTCMLFSNLCRSSFVWKYHQPGWAKWHTPPAGASHTLWIFTSQGESKFQCSLYDTTADKVFESNIDDWIIVWLTFITLNSHHMQVILAFVLYNRLCINHEPSAINYRSFTNRNRW